MNVILINCDDLGYGDLGCYGSKINKSPHIDKLAENGMRFTSFYCASPVCSPSRSALMTGCYPSRIGINKVLFPGEAIGLNPDEFTLPRLFKNAGYATMIVGKWHCGDQKEFLPDKFGFDEYYGLPYSNDMGICELTTDKVKSPPLPLILNNEVIEEQPDQRSLTSRYAERCVDFIRRNKDNDFFLYFAQMHVHLPLYAADRFVRESENGDFGACVASLDWACGVIVNELEKLNILEDTLIIFTSDNGATGKFGSSNLPLRGSKTTTWEGGMRVPCIMYWKGKIKPCVNDKLASQIDLLPTFASILNQKLSDNVIDGVDLSKMLFNDKESPRNEYVYYRQGINGTLEAIRKDNWKLHFYKGNESVKLLYDLDDDISEENDLYDSNPDIVAKITEIYNNYLQVFEKEKRDCLTVENPVTLTVYDPEHPYYIAMYDKNERG